MKLTRNLKIFIVVNTLSTILFGIALAISLGVYQTGSEPNTFEMYTSPPLIWAFVWAFVLVISSIFLEKYDDVRKSRKNLQLYYWVVLSVNMCVVALVLAVATGEYFVALRVFGINLFVLTLNWLWTGKTLKGIEAKEAFK